MKAKSDRKKIRLISQSLGNQIDRIKSFNRISMDLAALLDDFIKANEKMTQKKLAEIFRKKESEISKWLSGKHNFTIKSIALIEEKLGVQLLFSKYDKQNQNIGVINYDSDYKNLIESLAKFVVVETIMKKPQDKVFGPSGNTIWFGSTSLCLSSDPKGHHNFRHKSHTANQICAPINPALINENELYQGCYN